MRLFRNIENQHINKYLNENNGNINNLINIELPYKEKNKGNNDKKSSTKSSDNTTNKSAVKPYIPNSKEKIKENVSSPITANVSDNNLNNESDRKKLIATNDISQLEYKSDLFHNLQNYEIDNKNNFIENQFSCNKNEDKENEYNITYKDSINGNSSYKDTKNNDFFNDANSLKSKRQKKEKKFKNEINRIDLLKDNIIRIENLNSKNKLDEGEEVVLDMDIDSVEFEENNKRKVKFNHNVDVNIISNQSRQDLSFGKYEEKNVNKHYSIPFVKNDSSLNVQSSEITNNISTIKKDVSVDNTRIELSNNKVEDLLKKKYENSNADKSEDPNAYRIKRNRSNLKNKKVSQKNIETKESDKELLSNIKSTSLQNDFTSDLKRGTEINKESKFQQINDNIEKLVKISKSSLDNTDSVGNECNRDSISINDKVDKVSHSYIKKKLQ